MKCIFCAIPPKTYILENTDFYVIPDKYPVSKGHCLIISKRHLQDYFELTDEEAISLLQITRELKASLDSEHQPTGYNLAMNCGRSAGQTVFHFHMHVIPRYK